MNNECCQTIDLLAYLNTDLSAEESQKIETHIQHCVSCSNELRELQESLKLLPFAIHPISPPPILRQMIFKKAYHIKPPISQENLNPLLPRPKSSQNEKWRGNRWTKSIHWLTWLSAALFITSVGLGTQVLRDQTKLSILQTKLSHAPKTVTLQPTTFAQKASGKAILVPQGKNLHFIVYVNQLKPTLGQQVYHIWLWQKNKRSSAGIMRVNTNGIGMFEQTLTGTLTEFDGIGITLEPNAHTIHPVGPKVLGSTEVS